MVSSASDFFKTFVEPTVTEFFEHPLDVRRGRIAAIVLYHMTDHYALEGYLGQDHKEIDNRILKARSNIISCCQDFKLIRDVADATKHAQLSTAILIPRETSSYDQVDVTPGLFQAPFGYGYFAEACEVLVTLDNGSVKSLLPAVRAVVNYWKSVFP